MCEYERNRVVVISIDLIIFVFGIVQMTLVSIIINSNSFKSEFYVQYIHSWWKKPMFGFRDSENRPCNPDEQILTLGYFPGNRAGCNCLSITSQAIDFIYHNTLVKKQCTKAMLRAGCINVEGNPPKEITKWRGKQFCIKSLINLNEYFYYMQDSVSQDEACKENYKDCGYLDSLQKMCLSDQQDCPIKDIIINKESNKLKYKSISLEDGYFLHYTNNAPDKGVIWSIKLSEGQPCIFEKEYNSNSDKYPLDFDFEYYGCNTLIGDLKTDKSFIKIDSKTKRNLYTENKINQSTLDKLSGYPMDSIDTELTLYKEQFNGYLKECINNKSIHPSNLVRYYDAHKNYSDLLITIATFCSISLLIFITNSIFKISYKYNTEACMNCFDYVYSITQIIVVAIASRTLVKFNDNFDITYSCDNKAAKELLNEVWIQLEHEKKFMAIILIFGLFPLILYLGNYIVAYIFNKCKYNCFDNKKCKEKNEIEMRNSNERNQTEEKRFKDPHEYPNRFNKDLNLMNKMSPIPLRSGVNNK